MPDIQIPNSVVVVLQIVLAFGGAFVLAIWVSLIVWTFRDVRSRSRDIFAVLLATLMVVIFGPLGLLLYFLLRPPTTLAELYERSLEEEALLQDLEERAVCPGCRRKVQPTWQACPECHTVLQKRCTNCGELLHLRWTLCPYCVTPVEPIVPVAQGDQYEYGQGGPTSVTAPQVLVTPAPWSGDSEPVADVADAGQLDFSEGGNISWKE